MDFIAVQEAYYKAALKKLDISYKPGVPADGGRPTTEYHQIRHCTNAVLELLLHPTADYHAQERNLKNAGFVLYNNARRIKLKRRPSLDDIAAFNQSIGAIPVRKDEDNLRIAGQDACMRLLISIFADATVVPDDLKQNPPPAPKPARSTKFNLEDLWKDGIGGEEPPFPGRR